MYTTKKTFQIRGRTDEIFKIYLIGCFHVGTIACHYAELESTIKQIAEEPNTYFIGMGDYGEFINMRDPRYDDKMISDWVNRDNLVNSQRDYIVNLLRPVKDKCLGLLYGNHEDKVRKFYGQNVYHDICTFLGVKELGFLCYMLLRFERPRRSSLIRLVVTHGSGGSATRSAKLRRLEQFMHTFHADVYGYGHVHDLIKTELRYKEYKDGVFKTITRRGTTTGCFFNTYLEDSVYGTYGERSLYQEIITGYPVVSIIPELRDIKIEHKEI